MRLKSDFAKRKSGNLETLTKHLIISEGSSTEPQYFENIKTHFIKQNIYIKMC